MHTILHQRARHGATGRRGLVAVAAIAGLVILAIVVTGVVQMAVVAARQTKVEQAAWQAEFLAAAGSEFAREALRKDANWSGATWTIPADVLGQPGEVTAKVVQTGESRRVEVRASFPAGGTTGVQRRLVVTL